MKFTILITGKNKDNELFKESTDIYNELLDEGFLSSVVVTAWEGESSSIIKYVSKYSLVELPFPNLNMMLENGQIDHYNSGVGTGYIWPQMKSVEKGLDTIEEEMGDEEVFVLKTRPDVSITKEFIKKIFTEISSMKVNCELTGLSNKIWIPWYDMTNPFYMGAECYCGLVSDIKKLVNYRNIEYPRFFKGISHVRILIEPFIETHPILKNYLKGIGNCLSNVGHGDVHQRKSKTLSMIDNDIYCEILTEYYNIIGKYYHILTDANGSIKHRTWNNINHNSTIDTNLTIKDNLITKTPLVGIIFGYNNEYINKINNKEIKIS